MFIYRRCSLIRIWNYFVYEFQISGFRNILIHCREQPQCVICPIFRMTCFLHIRHIIRCILMTWIMRKFDKWKSSSIIYLRRKHKADLFFCHFRRKMYHTLDILNSIPVSISVPQPAIGKGCRTRPDKCHKTVIRIPCINHGIKFLTRCLNLKMGNFLMPVANQFFYFFFTYCRRIFIVR